MIDELTIYAPEGDFLLPYLRRELPGATFTGLGDAHAPESAIMVSSADVYMQGTIVDADEESSIARDSKWVLYEKNFTDFCHARHIRGTILRCGDIVGTGMTGFPRALAEAIYRGRFFHFPGNEARRSVVHATVVARTVANIASNPADTLPAVINIHDGSNPTIDELADALAYRIHNKRISNLSLPFQQWVARRLYGQDTYALYTTTRTLASIHPASYIPSGSPAVCQYLRTHTYDDTSL